MRNEDVHLKTSLEVARIRKSCKIIETILKNLESYIVPGIQTLDIAAFCQRAMKDNMAEPSTLGYRGYPSNICTSVNSVAVHGIPDARLLEDGDIITVDIVLNTGGWHGDGAWTYIAGKADPDILRLYKAALDSSLAGLKAARAGGRIGDIGHAISRTAARWGCSVLDSLAGHGIGVDVHEDPVILPVGDWGSGTPLVPGMVFTIEPVLTLGDGRTKTLDDGWGIVTADGRPAAQFENTVAIFGQHTEVLTRPELSFSL